MTAETLIRESNSENEIEKKTLILTIFNNKSTICPQTRSSIPEGMINQ